MDLDKSGQGYQRVRTYLGPTLGWKDELVLPTVDITTGGSYTVKPGDSLILVDVPAAVQILLPDVVSWVQQPYDQPATAFERAITVKDLGGNAGNFNIVITPFGQQSIDNIQSSILLATARANVKVIPLIDLSGWAIESSSIAQGGGGGGGGDVFKAGNNTFTGTNDFQGNAFALTSPLGDSSKAIATNEFVKGQGYIGSAALAPYALVASPTFTGDPKAPTPAPGDNDTSIATTAYVQAALASGGAAAPVDAQYITASVHATLTAERVLTNTASITWDFSTPGQAKANTAVGGGNVSNSGTPVNGQIARWVTATTIEGVPVGTFGFAPIADPVFTGDPKAPTPPTADNDTSIATTAYVKANLASYQPVGNYQPLDGDLTALSALAGTNTLYYRSATDIWSPVSFSGLSFSGGVLTVTAGGGNVSNSGTPTNLQLAQWTDATHIQGISISSLGFAPIANPVFTGDPQAPTPATVDNDTSIATTAFVKAQGYAPLASPVFTGNPQAPTPTAGDNDTSLATTAFVAAAVGAISGSTPFSPPQGRLTLLSGTPVMTASTASRTQAIYTPYVGDKIPIYNGTSWTMRQFSELSGNSTGAAADKNQDWFVWDNGGTLALIKGPDWSTDTTRSLSLMKINGIWVNQSDITSGPLAQRGTYVGTTRTYLDVAVFLRWSLGGATVGGLAAYLYVWNAYNRVDVGVHIKDTTVSWTYNAQGWRVVNASVQNAVYFVQGFAEECISANYSCMGVAGAAGDNIFGICLDNTGLGALSVSYFSTGGTSSTPSVHWSGFTTLGYHTILPIERQQSTAGVMTNFGTGGGEQTMNFSARFRM